MADPATVAAQRKAEKELARYRKEMAKKMAKDVAAQPAISETPQPQQQRKKGHKREHPRQQEANSFEENLLEQWRSVPQFWVDDGRARRNRLNLWVWAGIAVFCVWLLALFLGPASSPRAARSNPMQVSRPQDSVVAKLLQGKRLTVTKHASCRMDCRFVTHEEVGSLISKGWVNEKKSDPDEVPCPVYVLETPGCHTVRCPRWLRAVVAACGHENRLITVVDLKKEHTCWCS